MRIYLAQNNGTTPYRFQVRCVGAFWYVYHVLQLLLTRSTQQNLSHTRNSTMKHLQNHIEILPPCQP